MAYQLRFIQAPTGPEWVQFGVFKMGVTDPRIKVDLINLGLAEDHLYPVQQVFADWLINYPADIGMLMAAIGG